MKKTFKNRIVQISVTLVLLFVLVIGPLSACSKDPLNPKKPVTITVWHYYNGPIKSAFDDMVAEFNATTGSQRGVIVESLSYSSTSDLEKAVIASAKNEVNSEPIPNIFAAYPDTAYEIEKMGLLADLGQYLTKTEQDEYIDSYIEEGKIGLNGELRIFPIAKSSEIMVLNDTDWLPFATEKGYSYNDLKSYEKLAEVASDYYAWTDAKTPDIANDGKAFYGRDSMANFFIIVSKEFDKEIFEVSNGKGSINIDESIMKKLWDYYYVPYISGHYYASSKFRSDNAKKGEILAYVGSTASANYSPNEVTIGENKYPISSKILSVPHFNGGKNVQVQQGAGMVVSKTDKQQEFASVLFLKWFTQVETNTIFAAKNAYIPVKKEASNYQSMIDIAKSYDESVTDATKKISISEMVNETIKVTFNSIKDGELYASKAFDGGTAARNVLDIHLQTKADADRNAVIALIEGGMSHSQAVEQYKAEEKFQAWFAEFKVALNAAVGN